MIMWELDRARTRSQFCRRYSKDPLKLRLECLVVQEERGGWFLFIRAHQDPLGRWGEWPEPSIIEQIQGEEGVWTYLGSWLLTHTPGWRGRTMRWIETNAVEPKEEKLANVALQCGHTHVVSGDWRIFVCWLICSQQCCRQAKGAFHPSWRRDSLASELWASVLLKWSPTGNG